MNNEYIKELESLTIMDCIVNADVYEKTEEPHKYLFVDFDGTVRASIDNKKFPKKGYAEKYPRRPPSNPNEVHIFQAIPEKIMKWKDAGYRIIGVTNQSGVEFGPDRGGMSVDTCKQVCLRTCEKLGIDFPVIFAPCKNVNPAVAELRKPKTGMVDLAVDLFGPILKEESYLIGDFRTDIEMGEKAGLKTFKVRASKSGRDFPVPEDL